MSLDKNPNHHSYLYSFAGEVEKALDWFKQHPMVEKAKIFIPKEKSVHVQFKKALTTESDGLIELSNVTKELVAQNFPVIGIEEKKEDLEEIFFNVIRSQPNSVI